VRCAALNETMPWKSVWVDQVSDDTTLPCFDAGVVILKALPLFDCIVPEGEDAPAPQSFQWTAQQHLDWMEDRGAGVGVGDGDGNPGWSIAKFPLPSADSPAAAPAAPQVRRCLCVLMCRGGEGSARGVGSAARCNAVKP
jgi:hypothetical protein